MSPWMDGHTPPEGCWPSRWGPGPHWAEGPGAGGCPGGVRGRTEGGHTGGGAVLPSPGAVGFPGGGSDSGAVPAGGGRKHPPPPARPCRSPVPPRSVTKRPGSR